MSVVTIYRHYVQRPATRRYLITVKPQLLFNEVQALLKHSFPFSFGQFRLSNLAHDGLPQPNNRSSYSSDLRRGLGPSSFILSVISAVAWANPPPMAEEMLYIWSRSPLRPISFKRP